jgi:hypothetical protein
MFLCVCSVCGSESEVIMYNLKIHGCLPCANVAKKGRPGLAKTHGMSKSSTYRIWKAMRRRCEVETASEYRRYGGRGISVCGRWASFESFFADMGERPSEDHSIDRIDNDGNYEPGNCRWATDTEQARNKRNNVHLTALGATKTMAEWSEQSAVTGGAIAYRLRTGWSPDDAVMLPAGARGDGRLKPGSTVSRWRKRPA